MCNVGMRERISTKVLSENPGIRGIVLGSRKKMALVCV